MSAKKKLGTSKRLTRSCYTGHASQKCTSGGMKEPTVSSSIKSHCTSTPFQLRPRNDVTWREVSSNSSADSTKKLEKLHRQMLAHYNHGANRVTDMSRYIDTRKQIYQVIAECNIEEERVLTGSKVGKIMLQDIILDIQIMDRAAKAECENSTNTSKEAKRVCLHFSEKFFWTTLRKTRKKVDLVVWFMPLSSTHSRSFAWYLNSFYRSQFFLARLAEVNVNLLMDEKKACYAREIYVGVVSELRKAKEILRRMGVYV